MLRSQYFNNATLMRIASYASVVTALMLIIAKLLAWYISDSLSILASLIDSSLDLLASLVNLLAIRHALQPADKEHRFGHGKAEPLAALGQSMFITGSAIMLLFQASGRVIHPQPLTSGVQLGVGVMLFSILATIGLLLLQRYVIHKTNSAAIRADSLHYRSDLLINLSVITALLLTQYGLIWLDPVMAICIAIYVLFSAWRILKDAIDLLMDHEITDAERQQIFDVALNHPLTKGIHDLRTRRSGTTVFIQLHLELDPQLSLQKAHDVSNEVSREILGLFDEAEVIIHQDPLNDEPIEQSPA
ncbi:cation diffusion facilitator family transporter [Methylophaga pinxianii]|uniref:cation diffusion facilitator family transporter n=1 Tax=Methylophaga pinxianii TaxID=2881052 RepID=UPI001CF5F8A5|nr:cation diffusion facilitator family transporter [Methylophaga pinxianii]MCB2427548.1 cation diffusion facilitator family transporter [Methylophaga pinxianii]UPH44552.1 cation diffusion facilitator family transporter [Methylophaga pinxianii]